MVQSKAINLKKNNPMQTIASTVGTPPNGISEDLVNVIQPTLNKNKGKTFQHSFTKLKNGQLIAEKYKYDLVNNWGERVSTQR